MEDHFTAHTAVWGSGIPTASKGEPKKNPEAETLPSPNDKEESKRRHDSERDREAEEPMTGSKEGPKDEVKAT